MKSKLGVIYEIMCISEKKLYVGKRHDSANAFLNRNYYGGGKIIRPKVKEHSKQDFNRYILEEIDISTPEGIAHLCQREEYWIAKLNTMWPNGYNLAKGGQGGCTPEQANKNWEKRQLNGTDKGWKMPSESVVKGIHTKLDREIPNGFTTETVKRWHAEKRAKGLHIGGTSEQSKKIWEGRSEERRAEISAQRVKTRRRNIEIRNAEITKILTEMGFI